jgi:hypothetical protein
MTRIGWTPTVQPSRELERDRSFLGTAGLSRNRHHHSRNEETAAAMEKYDPNARLAPFRSFEVLSEMLVV